VPRKKKTADEEATEHLAALIEHLRVLSSCDTDRTNNARWARRFATKRLKLLSDALVINRARVDVDTAIISADLGIYTSADRHAAGLDAGKDCR